MAFIKVTYPEGGITLRKNSTYEIRWESGGISTNVKIRLFESTTMSQILAIVNNTSNDGSYFWKVPETLDCRTDYFIRVKTTDDLYEDDGSDFEITNRFAISDFSNLTDFEKVVLVEIRAGVEIPLTSWISTVTSGDEAYYLNYFVYSEIIAIEENGVELTRTFSVSECNSTTGSFFHDMFNRKLYIHTSNDDSPETSGYIFIGYCWLCFTNSQFTGDDMIDFIPQDATQPVSYLPFLDTASIPTITQAVQDFYKTAVSTQFGSLSFLNDGWWWRIRNYYPVFWHNKEVYVKIGERGTDYADFVTIFPGRTRVPQFTDEKVTIAVKDQRTGILKSIPVDEFNTTNHPDISDTDKGRPVPILFGIKEGIVPVYVEQITAGYVFQISQTSFATGMVYALNSVDAVYREGVRIYETTDYSVDLNAGTITVFVDPGNEGITVDAQGICCGYDFTGATSGLSAGDPTGVFSENVADILFFVLRELNEIPLNRIDLNSFDDLQNQRTQRLGWYLETPIQTMEFVRLLQSSAIFHFIPTLDGNYMVRYYDRFTPSYTPHFYNEDYKGFKLIEDTETCYEKVTIYYDRHPTEDEWKIVSGEIINTELKHDIKETLPIQTALVAEAEALALLAFWQALVENPGDKISVEIPAEGLELIPTDKAYFSRSIVDADDNAIAILDEELYQLLQVRKNISTARVGILGLEDSQAGGVPPHADVPHEDWHGDDHDDVHTDGAHADVPHTDSYTDSYTDIPHTDDYEDFTTHDDIHGDHNDAGYIDWHLDHDDHTDDHDDIAHTDTHTDSHTDIPHEDGHADAYTDEHTDEHEDVPHTDSEI